MAIQWSNGRGIKERIYIQGNLELTSATHLGSGDSEGLVDLALLRDAQTGGILLTGTTIAGALRGNLCALDAGKKDQVKKLFGSVESDKSSESWIITEDAVCPDPHLETKDGVQLDSKTRTAEDKKKFDSELISAGAVFPIGFELLLPKDSAPLLELAVTALKGLEKGFIRLGKRKTRGQGECRVTSWKIWRFPLDTPENVVRWLESWPLPEKADGQGEHIDQLLLQKEIQLPAPSGLLDIEVTFALDSPLLIRAAPPVEWDRNIGAVMANPDTVQQYTYRDGQAVPIIHGSSIAGALRARAERISNELDKNGKLITLALFGGENPEEGRDGARQKKNLTASRVWVDDALVVTTSENDFIQTRIEIDRFTGGTVAGALFSERPVLPLTNTKTTLHWKVRDACDEEVGLMLLLLKDLWTGDLRVGGEISIGRGCLRGVSAVLSFGGKAWSITALDDSGRLSISDNGSELNQYVERFAGNGHHG